MEEPQLQDIFWIANRITGYLNATLTSSEQKELFKWVEADEANYDLFCQILDEQQLEKDHAIMTGFDTNAALQKVLPKLSAPVVTIKFKRNYLPYIAAAASLVLCLAVGVYFILNQQQPVQSYTSNKAKVEDHKVYLTLSDGRRISLSDAGNGQVAEQAGVKISKTKDGQLIYQGEGAGATVYNTISIPKGNQYQIILPDGTKVWLNAASSLKYPATFANLKERKVELSGEAYFEVKHDARQPFRVQTRGQVVEDIGTAFNINAYSDEKTVETSLIEGAVKVTDQMAKQSRTIIPGEQTLVSADQAIQVKKADLQKITAWKNGEFFFKDDDLSSILRQISRWYDVAIVYQGPVPVSKFTGQASRKITLDQMMDIIKESGIQINLTNRTLFVKASQ